MPNNIVLAKGYVELLDEVYRGASVTADLTSDPSLIRQGANVNEILYVFNSDFLQRNIKRRSPVSLIYLQVCSAPKSA